MKTLLALVLAPTLAAALGGCTSGDDEPTASGSAASSASATPSSPTPTPTKAPVRFVGHSGAVATYCAEAGKDGGFPDFVWTGPRLAVRDDATVTAVSAQTQQVDILHSWIVPGGGPNSGAFMPWSAGRVFLHKLDWAQRTNPRGAELTAGSPYTLVLRLRPRDNRLPDGLRHLQVHYRTAGGQGTSTNPDRLEFKQSC